MSAMWVARMMWPRRKPEIVEWLRRVDIGPNDVLALKVNRPLTIEQVHHLREQIAEALPKGTNAFLISHDMEITIIGLGRP